MVVRPVNGNGSVVAGYSSDRGSPAEECVELEEIQMDPEQHHDAGYKNPAYAGEEQKDKAVVELVRETTQRK